MLAEVLVTWVLASSVSSSDASGPTFSLSYAVGRDCPSQASLEAAIVSRAPNARRVEEPNQAEVRFEVEAAGSSGRLRATLRDGTREDREIDADDCAEAVQSMAVIAAMILASRDAPPPSAPPPKVQEKGPESPPAEPPAPKPAAATPPPEARRQRPTWLMAGAGLGLESGAAPDPAYAGSAFPRRRRGSIQGPPNKIRMR